MSRMVGGCLWAFKMKPVCVSVLAFLCCTTLETGAVKTISFRIGGLFNGQTDKNSQLVYESMVQSTLSFHGDAIHPPVNDSYSTALHVCAETTDEEQTKSVVALVDARPTFGECDITCLFCNTFNIPHLAIGWQPLESEENNEFTFFYHPPAELISRAYAALIKEMQWDKFTFLFENDDGFIRIQEVINTWPTDYEPIVYRQLDPDGDNREVFKEIFKVERISYHILDCDVKNIKKYMREIVDVENSTAYQSFILTALDAYTISLHDVPALMANVSTLHFTHANNERWMDLGMKETNPSLETALTADAMSHLEKAIGVLVGNIPDIEEARSTRIPSLCFDETEPWAYGQLLKEAMMNTTTIGFTGNVEFDPNGKRRNVIISYSKLSDEMNFSHAGFWDSRTEKITNLNTVSERSSAVLTSKTIMVASLIGEPYFMLNKSEDGEEAFEGYAVDLVDAIFEHMKRVHGKDFTYKFYSASGGQGNPIEGTRKWSGLIGELREHKADLAVCDITITSERNGAVDFSIPFMSLGISILTKDMPPPPADKFSFIKPLSIDVWLCLATVYILVSFVLLICARMCEDDWVNPHPCNQNPENLQNIWTLYNCMWLIMGSIMTQGCDMLPRAAGSRWITGVWWFFALIITASYTANMSTFLSNSRRNNDIADVKQLSEQTKTSYGAVYNSSTYKFFENSNDPVYSKIWSVMSSARPSVFTNNNDEGKRRVLKSKGKYAFFMESTAIEYAMQRNCSLKKIGGELDSKEYGIAMPKKSQLKKYVDNAILSLQESGVLEKLKKKWWETDDCPKGESEEDDGSLRMENTSGIFLVLGVGGILGCIVAVIDFMINASKIAVKEKITFKEAMASEWRASLDPRSLHKSVAPPRSAPTSESPSPHRERSQSRAVSVLRAASSFINFDEIY